jgi:GT2 family glycosyltransferase
VQPPTFLSAQVRHSQSPSISIITLHLRRQQHTRRLVESLNAHTTLPIELVVVSQEADAETRAFFRQIAEERRGRTDRPGMTVLFNERNVGTAAGRNQGLRAAGGSLAVLIDNDVEVTPGWLEPLLETLELDATAAAVGAMVLTPRGRPQYCSRYVVERSEGSGPRSLGLHMDRHLDADDPAINQACEVPWYPTTCLMLRRSCLAGADPFDEGFALAEEDKDLCLTLRAEGFRILFNPRSRVYHRGYPRDPDYASIRENLQLLHRDRRRFEAKWSCGVINETSRRYLELSGVTQEQIARYERFPVFMRVVP